MAAGILWSQQTKLAGAVNELAAWTQAAYALGVRVDSLTITLLDEDTAKNSTVIFDLDAEAGEYRMRTTNSPT